MYGFDRIINDEHGNQIRRVHFRERYQRGPKQRQLLAPSADVAAVEAVRFAFHAIHDGLPVKQVAIALNEQGPTTITGRPWQHYSIKRLLTNPVYAGRFVYGRAPRGKSCQVAEKSLIIHDESHEPIVSPEIFEDVQGVLLGRKGTRISQDENRYLLAGLIVCGMRVTGRSGECGARLPNGRRERVSMYSCCGGNRANRHAKSCINIIARFLEPAVLDVVKRELLSDENLDLCMQAHDRPDVGIKSATDAAIAQLKRDVETADRNLAKELDNETFVAIARQASRWRSELRKLQRTAVESQLKNNGSPKSTPFETLRECRDCIELAERGKLADALRSVIDSITVRRDETALAREVTAVVTFKPDLYFGEPIVIADEYIVPRRWRELAVFVAEADEPQTTRDLCREFRISQAAVSRSMSKAMSAGLVTRAQPCGWTSPVV